jgi:signal transduction histidine kinase
MAVTSLALVPRRWLRLPVRSARLRLTLMYSGMFLLLGTAIIAVIVVLVGQTTSIRAVAVHPGPGGVGEVIDPIASQQRSADMAAVLTVSWLALALSAAASAVLGWFAAGRVLRPLRQMTEGARAISAGNLHQRLALSGPDDEFKQLGDTIDELLGRLEASFAAQRRFVANAAHELRTPLTLERTLLQVALADPNANATSLRTTCEELLASGRSQERLLEALLTLATSERGLEQREPLDLGRVAAEALEQARLAIERRHLRLTTELRPAAIRGDGALVGRLIANILENSIDHNHTEGWIAVRTATDSERAVLSVANSGPRIGAHDVERLFEPFQRGGAERTHDNGHHGLGLSIARAIAVAHGGAISAAPEPGGGLVVTVKLPADRAHTRSQPA